MIVGLPGRFIAVPLGLAATVSFLVGLIVAGTMTPAPASSAPEPRLAKARTAPPATAPRARPPAPARAGRAGASAACPGAAAGQGPDRAHRDGSGRRRDLLRRYRGAVEP